MHQVFGITLALLLFNHSPQAAEAVKAAPPCIVPDMRFGNAAAGWAHQPLSKHRAA